jgi:hypothetical protein
MNLPTLLKHYNSDTSYHVLTDDRIHPHAVLLKPNNIKTLFQTKTKKTFFKIIIKHIYIYIYIYPKLPVWREASREEKSPDPT